MRREKWPQLKFVFSSGHVHDLRTPKPDMSEKALKPYTPNPKPLASIVAVILLVSLLVLIHFLLSLLHYSHYDYDY